MLTSEYETLSKCSERKDWEHFPGKKAQEAILAATATIKIAPIATWKWRSAP
jgi:hypothetical protein